MNIEKAAPNPDEMMVLMLRDVVVYPHMVVPLFVGREKSVKALEISAVENQKIFLVTKKNAAEDDPPPENIYTVGTVANILQMLRLPDGTVKALVEGIQRGRAKEFSVKKDALIAKIELINLK